MNAATRAIFVAAALAACGPKSTTTSIALPPPPPEKAAPVGEAQPAPPPPEAPLPELKFPDNEAFRKTQPGPGAVKDFKAPPIQRYKLKNGVEVFHVERHELPTVSADLVFEGGSVNDPPGKEGLATMCVALMGEGTEKLDKIAYNEALADLASSVNTYAAGDQQGVGMESLTKNLDATIALWADTLLHPGMRADELERMRKRRLESLKQQKGNVSGVAGRLTASIVHGDKHPYGRIPVEDSIKAVKLDECKKYLGDYFKPAGARLYVVGDITKADVEKKLGGAMGAWKGAPKKTKAIPKPAPRKGRVFFVDVPGSPQSAVALVHVGPPRKAKDYFATSLMAAILGGGFASRINMNIREEKGWAYGARGGFGYNRSWSVFNAGGSIVAEKTKDAVLEILKEIKGMRDAEARDDEMEREKDGAILALPSLFQTRQSVLGTYRSLLYFGLPLNYYDSYVKNVQGLDKAAIKKAAMAHLESKDLRLFVVGDGKTVLPMLKDLVQAKALGAGDLVVLDADGKVLPQ